MNEIFLLPFNHPDAVQADLSGGKGKNLALMATAGFPVPSGFIVTTRAYLDFIHQNRLVPLLQTQLNQIKSGDQESIKKISDHIRRLMNDAKIPTKLENEIKHVLADYPQDQAFAIRSSATAEDLPFASFAGQQDTYLNINGVEAILNHIRKCWASLFTERAITYRLQNKINSGGVKIAVVVQKMIFPTTSGILFTADPVTNNHRVMTINAGFGLGEALVSGLVNPDLILVDKTTAEIIQHKVEQKKIAINADKNGGTKTISLEPDQQNQACLSADDIQNLLKLGLNVENTYQQPQDIEWAIDNKRLYLLQTRPITSLFPIPSPPPADNNLHLYFSFGHAQMMTEPISPMGLSMLEIFLPFGRPPTQATSSPHLKQAAGRVYVDLSPLLNTTPGKKLFPKILTFADPVAVQQIQYLIHSDMYKKKNQNHPIKASLKVLPDWIFPLIRRLVGWIFFKKVDDVQNYVADQNQQYLQTHSEQIKNITDPVQKLNMIKNIAAGMFHDGLIWMLPLVVSGVLSQVFLSKIMKRFGIKKDFSELQRGLSGNITTEMDLMVGDLADEIRNQPVLKELLTAAMDDPVKLEGLLRQDYPDFYRSWQHFLRRFGMRGPGEIDLGRPRWVDNPQSLIQILLANGSQTTSGSHRSHFEKLKTENQNIQQELLGRVKKSPSGFLLTPITKRCLWLLNNLAPLREHPKYMIIRFLDLLRKELLQIGVELKEKNHIDSIQDIWFLTFEEVLNFIQGETINLRQTVEERKTDYNHYEKLKPPRVITSDGEIPHINLHKENYPANILVGNPVSAGKVRGIARVITNPAHEQLQPGEILVAPFTDPGWTPLFINAAGVVLETGGLMTHGSVVAREYGLPAVVGIVDATNIIINGMEITVDGDNGTVELPI